MFSFVTDEWQVWDLWVQKQEELWVGDGGVGESDTWYFLSVALYVLCTLPPQNDLGDIQVQFESSFLFSWYYCQQCLKYFDKIIFNTCMIFFSVSKRNTQELYSVWFKILLQYQRFRMGVWGKRECIILRDFGVGTNIWKYVWMLHHKENKKGYYWQWHQNIE